MSRSWDLYRSFLAILRSGSLSGAARQLGLTQPTLGRHLEQLEQELGIPLFLRSPAGLTATPAAMGLISLAEAMESAAFALERGATADSEQVAGTVRITASEIIGAEILPAIFGKLQSNHSQLRIELSVTNLNQNLLRHDADIAVRMTVPEQGALIAKNLGNIPLGLFAHASYLKGRMPPSNLSDLTRHCVVGFDKDMPAGFINSFGVKITREMFTYRCDNHLAQLAALRAGLGIGICQVPLASRDKHLIRVLPKIALSLPLWVVMHEDQRRSLRIRKVYDGLVAGLSSYLAEGGRSPAKA